MASALGSLFNGIADGYREDRARQQRAFELDVLSELARRPPPQQTPGFVPGADNVVQFPRRPGQRSNGSAAGWDASSVDPRIATGIEETADALGVDPIDLATVISYETAGTFNPTKKGPTTQWGQHEGLIQWGQPQQKKYGVDLRGDAIGSQLGADGAIVRYMRNAGVRPGMGLMDLYSAVNAGQVGLYNRTDENNGGAPGTVADKVNNQMSGHRAKAEKLLAKYRARQQVQAPPPTPAPRSVLQTGAFGVFNGGTAI